MTKGVFKLATIILLSWSISGCLNNDPEDPITEDNLLENIIVASDFDFSTTKDILIELKAPSVVAGAVFDIYRVHPTESGLKIATGTFDKNNTFSALISVPTFIDTLEIVSRYFGLEKQVIVPIEDNKVTYNYNVHYPESSEVNAIDFGMKSALVANFSYMGSYNANGFPNYLYKVNDHAWESLLSNLNQTLPEGVSVVNTKPQFIASGTQTNLVLKEKTNVYVTFAGEGTSLTSALGYFIYDGTKPTDAKHTIIFPNASSPGSGGSLHSGDQVLLGEFPANTTIGWFLVPNGWDRTQRLVKDKQGIYYSMPEFNPETSANQKQHMVLLKDIQNEVIVLGFEDQKRDLAQTDNDFNDAVFYITLDKLDAADLTNVSATSSPVDTDGDGIIDSLDEYPFDPTLAFNNNTISGSNGSLAFEDLWPSMGDFDFNDLVVDYNFNPVTDVNNLVKILEINLTVRHIGASYKNGFAFELPVAASTIESVTGSVFTSTYVNLAANGTENGSDKAIVFAFDNAWSVLDKSLTIKVVFTNPIPPATLGTFPFNPFITVNGDRGREVHLADKAPTSKANMSLFGQFSDFSKPANGRYYRTNRNLPWAVNIAGDFAIPKEKKSINNGYLKFVDWAESAGSTFPDWYLNLTGYRDLNYLY